MEFCDSSVQLILKLNPLYLFTFCTVTPKHKCENISFLNYGIQNMYLSGMKPAWAVH